LITAIASGRVEPYALGGLGLIAASQDDSALAAEHACDLIAGYYVSWLTPSRAICLIAMSF
jgi:hypothetical protein